MTEAVLPWGSPSAMLAMLKRDCGFSYAQFSGEREEDTNLSGAAAEARFKALGVRLVRVARMTGREATAALLYDHEQQGALRPICTVTCTRVCIGERGCLLPEPPAPHSGNDVCACHTCGAREPPPKTCGACGQVAYCNTSCQRADWKAHKPRCAELKKMSYLERLPEGHPLKLKGREQRMKELMAAKMTRRARVTGRSLGERLFNEEDIETFAEQFMREIP